MLQKTNTPTDEWPEGIAFSARGRAWVFLSPSVIFTQTTSTEVGAEDAQALIDLFLWLDSHHLGEGSPAVVHDWRSLEKLPREARTAFLKRRAEIKTKPSRVFVAVKLNPVHRMALQTVMLGSQMISQAVPTSLVHDPFAALRGLGHSKPDGALHLRLRDGWRSAQ